MRVVPFVLLTRLFSIPSPPWFVVNIRPDDPTLSCYVCFDGNRSHVWVCAADRRLAKDVDGDDSY